MDFSKMSIGTKVMSIQLGECDIESTSMQYPYCISCRNKDGRKATYTASGFLSISDALPSLTLIEPQLTPEEIFFNEVKGKKIRWSNFSKGEYFIPIELLHDARMKGLNENGEEDYWNIENGFDNLGFKSHWEFYTVPEPKYRPYTYEEACEHINRIYKWSDSFDKGECSLKTVSYINSKLGFNSGITPEAFLRDMTWKDDGTPCGVEVER